MVGIKTNTIHAKFAYLK